MATAAGRCSIRSELANEPLAGTASTVRRWLLVEHGGPWGRNGLSDARLPWGLGGELLQLGVRSGSRVVLVRRPDRRVRDTIACFAVDASATDPWLGRVELDRIEDAIELDPRDRGSFAEPDGPLAVVCTHGRRDPCCAERGRPLARAAAAAYPESTWESTHIGGDRFAGNLVLFPHGFYFGHVEAAHGPEIVRRYDEGRIALEWFRGRSSYPMPVQAAECALRIELGLDGIDDLILRRSVTDGDRSTAVFGSAVGVGYEVLVERSMAAPMRLTCHARNEEPPSHWILSSIGVLA